MPDDGRRSVIEPTTSPLAPDVVVVPNCLRGYASAADVAAALAAGVREARPEARTVCMPLADGGDGTLDALHGACGGTSHEIEVADLFGRPHKTTWLALDRVTAAVETAAICGLGALRPDEMRPLQATSAGTGQAIAAAVATGATTVLLGLGGTGVVDGGAGALAALGARFLDRDRHEVKPTPARMPEIAAIDLAPARHLLSGVTLRFLADVRTPLSASLDSIGAHKGVTAENRPAVVRALRHLMGLLTGAGDPASAKRFGASWFGAGGGIGFGLAAVAVTTASSGARTLLEIVDAARDVATAGLALTAEGAVDSATWEGKLPGVVAALRQERGLPTAIVAVRFSEPDAMPLVTKHLIAGSPSAGPLTGPALRRGLANAALQACRTWQS